MMKKSVLMLLGIVIILLFLVGCIKEAKELSEQELQELDEELESLPNEELQEIATGSEEGKALAGEAIGKFKVPSKVVMERAKTIYEAKPVCGNDKCEKGENLLNCNTDCSKCYDTDYGKNLETFGAVYVEGEKLWRDDYCSVSKEFLGLFEYHCENGEAKDKFGCPSDKVCNNGECVNPNNIFVCGNGICENKREKEVGCIDCDVGACKGNKNQCNDKVDVFCACNKEEHLIQKEFMPCQGIFSCDNCGKQEALLDDFATLQSQVYDCLADYFQFKPRRISYPIVYDSEEELCNDKNGCERYKTPGKPVLGMGIFVKTLPGKWDYGENQVTKPENLVADKHEPTHHFLNYMLFTNGGWFDEAIAIQTNERLSCSSQEDPSGDSYLTETPLDLEKGGGVFMSDKTLLNDDYYQRLKNGETSLSDVEKSTHHIIGTLWILGLKLDYGCEKDCVRDIVLKLREYVEEQCNVYPNHCGFKRRVIFNTGKSVCPQKPDIPGPTGDVVWDQSQIPPVIKLPPPTVTEGQIGKEVPVPYWVLWGSVENGYGYNEQSYNTIIKQATDKVVGQDAAELFKLLEIQY